MTTPKTWKDFSCSANDGLRLAGRKYGWNNDDPQPVVCLCGLTRNAADFHELANYLTTAKGGHRRVLCLDYRGRGESEYDRNWRNYNPLVEAGDVLSAIDAAGLGHAHIIGTSRGGVVAMILSAMRPGMLQSVILNDIGPEIDARGLVRIKNYLEKARPPRNWNEAAEYLKLAGKTQFSDYDDQEWRRQAGLVLTEKDGKLVRRFDTRLVNTLKSINLDIRPADLWPQFTGLTAIPLMLIRGENSDLLSQNCVSKMQKIHSHMKLVNIANQGHAPDLGSAKLPQTIAGFLADINHAD